MHSRPTLSKRIPTAMAVAAAALLALPASGVAAETFGSRLVDSPNYGACSDPAPELTAPCSWVSYIHPAPGTGDPYAGGAPNDGVIVKFRIKAVGPGASVTFRLANISTLPPDLAQASAVATGPTVTIAGAGEIEEFPARVPVAKGNHLAIDTTAAQAIYETGGNEFSWGYGPALRSPPPRRTASCSSQRSSSPTPTRTASATRPRTSASAARPRAPAPTPAVPTRQPRASVASRSARACSPTASPRPRRSR
jgi:hypothetical protein